MDEKAVIERIKQKLGEIEKADSLGHENQESWQKLDSLFLRLLNIQ